MAIASDAKYHIEQSLHALAQGPLRDTALKFWETLGYRSSRTLDLGSKANFQEQFDPGNHLNKKLACWDDWQEIEFLFQLTDDDLQPGTSPGLFASASRIENQEIHSYVFFAIHLLAPGRRSGERKNKPYTRGELAGITRAVNRLLPMPALLLFRHGSTVTLAVINRRLHKRDEKKDVLEKVTVIKDIVLEEPHRAHLEILHDLSLGALYSRHGFTNFVGLHQAWAKTLDSSELNKRFYLDVANWFFWASQHARFPQPAHITNGEAYQSLSLIRLITRVVFCWFLKEKGLIPGELFRESRLREILKDPGPEKTTYYRAILQNLFFATLSVPMDERRFIGKAFQGKSHDYGKQYVYRFRDELQPDKMRELFGSVPFLNGGLFECLDIVPSDEEPDIEEVRIDGFSTKPHKQAKVPNFLFFGKPHTEDLRKAYGDELRFSRVDVLPLIEIFDRYKFTVAENTPVEEEIALDPELLGLVFENLLASFNEETKSTARKQTGAFYTPRVVVDYMVDEALTAHFKEALGNAPELSARLKKLFSYAEEANPFDDGETTRLLDAIDSGESTIKVLDPACGSGAFPMGILHRLVFLLGRLDPGNAAFRARQLARVRSLDVGREEAEKKVLEAFARNEDDYARKVYLIERCIYGVDINPIAVQIAKLRFFISLLVDQETSEDRENRGVLPLPNLETKFVAANSLVALRRSGQTSLENRKVREKTADLLGVRHTYFNERHWQRKKVLRRKDRELRSEIAALLPLDAIAQGGEADDLVKWDPYAPNESANFFDVEWMFALDAQHVSKAVPKAFSSNRASSTDAAEQSELIPQTRTTEGGFDIVIGNPPYVRQEQIKNDKPIFKQQYHCYTGTADLYVYFYERSFDLLKVGGFLCFISSNKYFRAGYGQRLRHFIASIGEVVGLIDFGDTPVFTAVAYPSIILVQKICETRDKSQLLEPPTRFEKWLEVAPKNEFRALIWEDKKNVKSSDSEPSLSKLSEIIDQKSFFLPQRNLTPDGWKLERIGVAQILAKLRSIGLPLGEYVSGRFYYGIKTGLNEAFVVNRETRDCLIKEDHSSAELLKPYCRGRDVKRWYVNDHDLWIIFTRRGIEIQKFPAIHEHLSQFEKQLIPGVPGGRKSGPYKWYEIQDNVAYWHEFETPKIITGRFMNFPTFAYDRDGFYNNNANSIIAGASTSLVGILNSLTAWWFLKKECTDLQNGYIQAHNENLAKIPIPRLLVAAEERISSRVTKILTLKKGDATAFVENLEAEIDGLVAHLYDLSESDFRTILDELELPDPTQLAVINAYQDAAKGLLK